jgi:hypothetical protein
VLAAVALVQSVAAVPIPGALAQMAWLLSSINQSSKMTLVDEHMDGTDIAHPNKSERLNKT